MAERKAVIKNADMSEDMQQDAVDCASQALEKYNIEKVCGILFLDANFNAYPFKYLTRILLLTSRKNSIRNTTLRGIALWAAILART